MSTFISVLLIFINVFQIAICQRTDQEFVPSVSAECRDATMFITVKTELPFNGAVHVTNNRKKGCMTEGDGNTQTVFALDLTDPANFCNIVTNRGTGRKSVKIAVRAHKTLELADDKFYNVTCNSGSSGNGSSRVALNFFEAGQKKRELTYGKSYTLKAVATRPPNFGRNFGMRVYSCVSYGGDDKSVSLIDARGCPDLNIMSKFEYDPISHTAEATIYEMFQFSEGSKVRIQCQVALCRGSCVNYPCSGNSLLDDYSSSLTSINEGDITSLASTSAFVLEPGDRPFAEASTDCNDGKWTLLLGLTITFAILFVIMLILNILLCVLMTCTCTKTEVIEKEPSEMDDYDPYKVGWVPSTGHQSQYGSRYSLNTAGNGTAGKPGYASGASTINSTTRSLSTNSDHYAMVHSRPNSRYSHHSTSRLNQHKTNGLHHGYD